MNIVRNTPSDHRKHVGSGVAMLDYILALGVVLPLLVLVIPQGRRAMQLVFELMCTLVAWPFL